MAIRGEVVIECDVMGCHAEQVYDADDLYDRPDFVAEDDGWQVNGVVTFTYICPQCKTEGKDA